MYKKSLQVSKSLVFCCSLSADEVLYHKYAWRHEIYLYNKFCYLWEHKAN